jgi:hypothetical protein
MKWLEAYHQPGCSRAMNPTFQAVAFRASPRLYTIAKVAETCLPILKESQVIALTGCTTIEALHQASNLSGGSPRRESVPRV